MSTNQGEATHASRVKFIRVIYACGHTANVKVAPAVSAKAIGEIQREAKRAKCGPCKTVATNKTRRARR